jgi:hypothetical protein
VGTVVTGGSVVGALLTGAVVTGDAVVGRMVVGGRVVGDGEVGCVVGVKVGAIVIVEGEADGDVVGVRVPNVFDMASFVVRQTENK